jgi:Putative transposase of IS4/5 family (DUF4096)
MKFPTHLAGQVLGCSAYEQPFASRCFVESDLTVAARLAASAQGWQTPPRSGIPWEMLPQELGCGSGMTCWRRLRDWQEAGIWQLIHFSLLDWLARYGQIDWSRAVVDGSSIRAVFGGFKPVPTPLIGPS